MTAMEFDSFQATSQSVFVQRSQLSFCQMC